MGARGESSRPKPNPPRNRRKQRQNKPESGMLDSARSGPSNRGQLTARDYTSNRISQRQKKEQQTRDLERLNRPRTAAHGSGRPAKPVAPEAAAWTALPEFLGNPTAQGPAGESQGWLGAKNERTATRTKFPIIAGPGERQRFITTFLDGRINDGMIGVEKASIRAQELNTIVSPSGANRLTAVEEVVSILTCFTKDEDTLTCAYLIDLVRFEKLSLDNVYNEFGHRAGGMVQQILVMESQPKLLVSQLELLSHPLHLQPVEPWVLVVLAFVLVEMFQQECIQLEWVEQAALALGHHQGLLSRFALNDTTSPETSVVGLLLLGSDLVQENVAFRGWHLADMEDVIKRLEIRRLACCDGLVQHGLKALVSVYSAVHGLVVSSEQYHDTAPPNSKVLELQQFRVNAENGLMSHCHIKTASFAAASVSALNGSAAAQTLVYLLRTDPERASLQAIEQATNAEVAGAAVQVAMSPAELASGVKMKSLADAMNHDMQEDALLATLADVHAQLVHAALQAPTVLRECVTDVIDLFGRVSPAKWNEQHAIMAAAISTEIELAVAALELWINSRSTQPCNQPVSTSLVEQAVKYVTETSKTQNSKSSKSEPSGIVNQIWQMAAVLWRLTGSEAVIAAAMIHQTNQLVSSEHKCEGFEGLRHLFSKEVASLVTELARAQQPVPEHHGSAFNPSYSQNALLIDLCIRLCYFVQTGTWRMDQRRRLLQKVVHHVAALPLHSMSNAHHILLRALKLQVHHDLVAQEIISLCLPCSVVGHDSEHRGVADWAVWDCEPSWHTDIQPGIQPNRIIEAVALTRSLQAQMWSHSLYSASSEQRSKRTPDLNGPKLHPTPPSSRGSRRSRESPLPPLGRASPIEMDSFGPNSEPPVPSAEPDSKLKAATPPDKAEREHILSTNVCDPTNSSNPIPVPPSQPSSKKRPNPRNNVGTIGQPKANSARPPSQRQLSRASMRSRDRQYRHAALAGGQLQMSLGDQAILDKLRDINLWQQPLAVSEQLKQLNPDILTVVLVEVLYRLGMFIAGSVPRGSPARCDYPGFGENASLGGEAPL